MDRNVRISLKMRLRISWGFHERRMAGLIRCTRELLVELLLDAVTLQQDPTSKTDHTRTTLRWNQQWHPLQAKQTHSLEASQLLMPDLLHRPNRPSLHCHPPQNHFNCRLLFFLLRLPYRQLMRPFHQLKALDSLGHARPFTGRRNLIDRDAFGCEACGFRAMMDVLKGREGTFVCC